jgi:4-hydroxybutyrate CoA-transferase
MKLLSVADAVSIIRSGDNVFIQGAAATPYKLITGLVARAHELKSVSIYCLHTEGPAHYATTEYKDCFKTYSLFTGQNLRSAIDSGNADYVPVFLSEVPVLFRKKVIPLDIALIHVSPPDKHGYCSLGTSVDTASAAVEMAKTVIAQINPNMPRTHGDGIIHINDIYAAVEVTDQIFEHAREPLSQVQLAIGRNTSELIENGAALQMGIGAIPDAVLASLVSHKDLGIHTEMFSDGLLDLIEKGVITNRKKRVHPGKTVSSFVLGTRKLYDFIDDNPSVVLLDVSYVNGTDVIRRNPKATAINSALEVDLTGQVCADSIGTYIYSGVGGQMDFIRGSALSEGGRPIIALQSLTSNGKSKIVPMLKPGAGVVSTRAHVHYIVTEYGVVNLFGKSLRERAKALINISHPDHREELEREAHALYKL